MKIMKRGVGLAIYIAVSIFFAMQLSAQEIKVNQVGYSTGACKYGIVPDVGEIEFSVVNVKTGEVAFTGMLTAIKYDSKSGDSVSVADFSAFSHPGLYYMVAGGKTSLQFPIAENNSYTALAKSAVKAFYYWRSSTAIEAEYAQEGNYNFARGFGHPDTKGIIHETAVDENRKAGEIYPSTKGWYDAGDYNKYVVNAAPSVYALLHAYELNPEYYTLLNLGIPESNNSIPDILDEVMWETDWLFSMQDPNDGGVYFKLTFKSFGGYVLPENDTRTDRYFLKKTTNSSYDFAGMMAKAYRSFKTIPGLERYADSCLKAARNAYKWAQESPLVTFKNPSDVSTGEYGDASATDEKFFASAELYLSTGEQQYLDNMNMGITFRTPSWPNVETLGLLSLANALDVAGLDDASKSTVREKLRRLADDSYNYAMANGYRTVANTFYWGSNGDVASKGMVAYATYRLTDERKYLTVAELCLHYLLGQNALNHSFVTGFGTWYTKHPHDRRMESDNIDAPIPGYLSGGPNANPADDCGAETYTSPYPAKKFVDLDCSYSTNEIAINWNAPLAFIAGSVDAEYSDLRTKPKRAEANSSGRAITIEYEDSVVAEPSFSVEDFVVTTQSDTLGIDSAIVGGKSVVLYMKDSVKPEFSEILLSYQGLSIVDSKGMAVAQVSEFGVLNKTDGGPLYIQSATVALDGKFVAVQFSKEIDQSSFSLETIDVFSGSKSVGLEVIAGQSANMLVIKTDRIYQEDYVTVATKTGAAALDGGSSIELVFPDVENLANPYPPKPISAEISPKGYGVTVMFDKNFNLNDNDGSWVLTRTRQGVAEALPVSDVAKSNLSVVLLNEDRFMFGDIVTFSHSGYDILSILNDTLLPIASFPVKNVLEEPQMDVYLIDTSEKVLIECEYYWYNDGFVAESCSEGGLNLGYADAGDWADYLVDVAVPGTYVVEFRAASATSVADVKLQSVLGTSVSTLGTYTMEKTGGWQTWSSVSGTVELSEGTQYLRVLAADADVNLNWLKIGAPKFFPDVVTGVDAETALTGIRLYPNPSKGKAIIVSDCSNSRYEITNVSGVCVAQGTIENSATISGLTTGIFMVKVFDGSCVVFSDLLIIE